MMQQQLRPAEYVLEIERNPGEFNQLITERLDQGWHLHGGPIVVDGKPAQALVRLGLWEMEIPDQPEPNRILSPVQ